MLTKSPLNSTAPTMPAARSPETADPFLAQLEYGYQQCFSQLPPPVPTHVTLAVSGGADSVALLVGTTLLCGRSSLRHSAMELSTQHIISSPSTCDVVHINHGLRGEDSDADADFVADLCERLDVECRLISVAGQTGQLPVRAESPEEAARRLRYDALLSHLKSRSSRCLVTAHHQEDQAETILHHAVRGSGLRGLRGMRAVRPLSRELSLLRPMLMMTRTEIDGWLQRQSIGFRVDSTNASDQFTRNRIRHEVLPLLRRSVSTHASRHLVSLGDQVSEALECLDTLATRILSSAVLEQSAHSCRIRRTALNEWPAYLIRHALNLLWIQKDWPRQNMTTTHWKMLADCSQQATPNSASLPGGIQVRIRADLMHFYRDMPLSQRPTVDG